MYSGTLHLIVWQKFTDTSEVLAASIIRTVALHLQPIVTCSVQPNLPSNTYYITTFADGNNDCILGYLKELSKLESFQYLNGTDG
jgi:hypothetical protein